ncbi:MAG: aldehyde dehydrogenase family protein, partial [Verrucomicrobia bacterium]|nr:aldehyde dehydrogenase family protein [Verrucomicrobiota bacterium]
MKFYLNGNWQDRDELIEVTNPFDGSVIDTVPKATNADVELALESAVAGAKTMAETTGYERFLILRRAADLMRERLDDLAHTISSEEGKTLAEGRLEVDRSTQTIELSGEEAKRLTGEVLPLDGGKDVRNKFGFTLRVPCGVVAAITPFNFPLNLVCHKVGPALAAGNSVIL